MRKHFLPFAAASVGEAEIASVVDTLRSSWITTGPKTQQFEQAFSTAVGADASLAVSSGTAAMHVALAALGVGPGSVVYTSPMTFCSTVHVIEQVGAMPVLVDVERDTLNMDPALLHEAVTATAVKKTSSAGARSMDVIMPVHFAGHPCEMDDLLKIAALDRLAVVEDAAHALPATYRGRTIGCQDGSGDVPQATAFSFYVTKNMTTGEGGMLVGSQRFIEEARPWSLHGMSTDAWNRYNSGSPWSYEVSCAGFKYNMTDVQAAIGLEQLKRLADFQIRRKQIAARYNEAFSKVAGLEPPVERSSVNSAWHLYVLRILSGQLTIGRDGFITELSERKIGTSVHFIPIHLHRYYRERYDWKPQDFPVAYSNFQRMLSLPLYPSLTDEDVQDVIDAVTQVARIHLK